MPELASPARRSSFHPAPHRRGLRHGMGPLSGSRDRLFADFPKYRSMTKESGRSRSAEASGAVLYEGTNLLTGPSQSGSLLFGEGMTLTWR